MTNDREGYHNAFFQLPTVVWEAILAESDATGESATIIATRILAKHYRISADKIPPRRRAGRKPKSEPGA